MKSSSRSGELALRTDSVFASVATNKYIAISTQTFIRMVPSCRSIVSIDAETTLTWGQQTHLQQTRGCEQTGALEEGVGARAELNSSNQYDHVALFFESVRRLQNFISGFGKGLVEGIDHEHPAH